MSGAGQDEEAVSDQAEEPHGRVKGPPRGGVGRPGPPEAPVRRRGGPPAPARGRVGLAEPGRGRRQGRKGVPPPSVTVRDRGREVGDG